MGFTQLLLFKEADKRKLCPNGSSMCNCRLLCDECLRDRTRLKWEAFDLNLKYGQPEINKKKFTFCLDNK